jgi:hypothetical protein
MSAYRVTQSTWDASGCRRDTAVVGPVRDALEAIAAQALDLSPAIASVVFDSPDHHSRITVFRPEIIEVGS